MATGRDAIRWPGRHPLGALPDLQKDVLGTFMRAAFDLGEMVDLRLPYAHVQATANPKLVEQVLLTQVNNFTKDTRAYGQLRRILGNGLLTSEGSFWLRQRRLAQPAFHRDRMAGWASTMVAATKELLASWQPRIDGGSAFDVSLDMMKLTMRIVGETLLSADVTSETDTVSRALSSGLETLQHVLTRPLSLPQWVPTPGNRAFTAAKAALDDVVYGIIKERRAGAGSQTDLLAMLMNTTDADTGERMNDEQLRDEVMTTFLAGHETTAVALSWSIYLLSKHPDIERRLRAELKSVVGDRDATVEDVPKLLLLGRVTKEVLRLYPPAWILGRRVQEDCVLEGFKLPARSILMFSAYVLHRLPETFDNPEAFDPDRWLEAEPGRGAYIPFSVGARKCIGDSFAQLEIALILATLLPKTRLSLVPNQVIVPEPVITLRPRNGVKVVATRVAAPT